MSMIRTYEHLSTLPTFKERFNYLKLDGLVGHQTFGFDRYINQRFYQSAEWKRLRDAIIIRDGGCDLGCPEYRIYGRVLIHHLNPVTVRDFTERSELLLNPDYLVCVSHETHNAIHYGDIRQLSEAVAIRVQGDTCPWRRV